MNSLTSESWGGLSLALKLPAVEITLSGLSTGQHASLLDSYQHFTQSSQQASNSAIHCNVFRMQQAPLLSADDLSLEGQYAPRTRHTKSPAGFHVTGINFEASLLTDSSGHSTLGVVHEHELAQAIVIENYLRIITAHKVLQYSGVVLHSAGLVFDEQAYIFSGRSNAGKTTLTRKAYAIGARVLSDDINLVLPGDTGYDAYAVPFTGEFGRTLDHVGGKESYPVAGIVLLEQSDHLETLPVSSISSRCPVVDRLPLRQY